MFTHLLSTVLTGITVVCVMVLCVVALPTREIKTISISNPVLMITSLSLLFPYILYFFGPLMSSFWSISFCFFLFHFHLQLCYSSDSTLISSLASFLHLPSNSLLFIYFFLSIPFPSFHTLQGTSTTVMQLIF